MPLIHPNKTLTELKLELSAKVDAEAGIIRKRHITLNDGMDSVYRKNEEDARYYLAHADDEVPPTPEEVPALDAVADSYNLTLYQAAQVVLYNESSWMVISGILERLRLRTKQAIDAAESGSEATEAAAVDWSAVP